MGDLEKAQAQLNEKEAELQEVQSMYERAVKEKQVIIEISFMSCNAATLITNNFLNVFFYALKFILACRKVLNKDL